MYYSYLETRIGKLLLAGDEKGLGLIGFPQGKGRMEPQADWIENMGCFQEVSRQLTAYFKGDLRQFELPLNPRGTPFQLGVLEQLQTIPYGETRSYADIARAIGSPKAVRAVGAANARNPLPIVIPCHRVIGSNGSLTGFGGGLPTKRFLLALEAGIQGEVADLFDPPSN